MFTATTADGAKAAVRFRMNGVGDAFLREPNYDYPLGVDYRFVAQTSGALIIEERLASSFPSERERGWFRESPVDCVRPRISKS